MKSGEDDLLHFASLLYVGQFSGSDFVVKVPPESTMNVLIPDTANADSPWANQKVREAVEYAIDKEGIAKTFGYGFLQAPYQIVPPACTLAYNADFTLGRKFDLEKAKQLLAEAGGGFETTIIVTPTADRDIISVIQDNLGKIGIKVES